MSLGFKTLLAVTGSDFGAHSLDVAIENCRQADAHLSVLALAVMPTPAVDFYGVGFANMTADIYAEGRSVAKKRADDVTRQLQDAQISGDVTEEFVPFGLISDIVARRAKHVDLTVIARARGEETTMYEGIIKGALFESGRSVLLTAATAEPCMNPKRVMIAWNAGREASRAVRDSLNLLINTTEVHIVMVDPVPSFEGHGPEPGMDVASYLARHGLNVIVDAIPSEGQNVADKLMHKAQDINADLIVMGGYGHSRFRQQLFGGTTRDMCTEPAIPVFMTH